jgi:nucleotide-binding universal stress UspA family protein
MINTVFHPSDFSKTDEAAFAHALKIALAVKGELNLLHAGHPGAQVEWTDFPAVRATLARWNILPERASIEGLSNLGLDVKKVKRSSPDPAKGIIQHIKDHRPDLVVLATHQRSGISRWLHPTMAEPIARASQLMTLFVPRRVMGFISAETGTVHLENILIPVDHDPSPKNAVDAAVALAEGLGCARVHFTFFHVGEEPEAPKVHLPSRAGWTFERAAWPGQVVEHILQVAEERNADLIVMATQGHRGFLDALRGSTTERVLRGARSPVLAVPAR